MQKLIPSLAACTALVLASQPAAAEGWTQVYGGVSVGVNAFTGRAQLIDNSTRTSVIDAGGPFGADIGASATIGVDYQLHKQFVIGAFASYDWSGAAIKASIREGSDSASASVVSIENLWTVGGRLGILMTPSTLAYGLVGYSWIDVSDFHAEASVGGSTGSLRLPLPSSQGVTFGGGIEHKVSENVSLRAEYRVTDYGRETIYSVPSGQFDVVGSARSHIARIGAFYRLGGSGSSHEQVQDKTRSWSGLYVGGGIGLAAFQRDLEIAGASPGHYGDEAKLTGLGGGNVLAGLTVGYDFAMTPRLVAGIVGTADLGGGRHALTLNSLGEGAAVDLLNLRHSWSIGGRLGYLLSPSLLGYVTAGLTQFQFDDAAVTVLGTDLFRFPFPALTGGFAGVGFEKQLDDRWSLKSEYVYSALETYKVSAFLLGASDAADVRFDPSSHAVKMSLIYRFGDRRQ